MKSKIATIVPLNHLNLIKDDDYFLALSHVASDSDYVNFFRNRTVEGKHVILDNSAIEMGQFEDFGEYFDKAVAMNASEIMFPDVYEDPDATFEEALIAARKFNGIINLRGMSVMVIPQGNSRSVWLANAQNLYNLAKRFSFAATIGITYRYNSMFGGSRESVVNLLAASAELWAAEIHLLGVCADPRLEAEPLLKLPNVRSLDSSYPSIYAQHGIELTPEMFSNPRPERNIDFLQDVYDENLLKKNIEVWKNACEPENPDQPSLL